MDKVLVLKNTKQGLTVDTVYNAQDTIVVQFKNETSISIPDNTIKIELPEKSDLDIFSSWAIIIGGLAGLVGAFIAFYQLFKRDKNKEKQIGELIKQTTEFSKQTGELIKQNKLNEKRLRMIVKPRVWSNGGGWSNGRINIQIDNRGELCFYDGYEILEGDKLDFTKWSTPINLDKEKTIKLTAPTIEKKNDEISFNIKIFYHDQENFKYETIFEWKGGRVRHLETIEK